MRFCDARSIDDALLASSAGSLSARGCDRLVSPRTNLQTEFNMIEAIGLDFGTANAVAALADGAGGSELIEFRSQQSSGATFRSALYF